MFGRNTIAQRIDLNGEIKWTISGEPICLSLESQYDPQICSDGEGGAIITWYDRRNGLNYDIYAQRIDSNGAIQWTTNGKTVCTESNNQKYPQICSDGAEGAIITWQDSRSGNDIYAQHIDSNGDKQWTPTDGVQLCSDIYSDNYPQICSDGAEGAIIVWEKSIAGDNRDLYAQRVDPNGIRQWGINGTAICTASKFQYDVEILNNAIGGAIITWTDKRSETDVYAQCVNPSGVVQWGINGIPICQTSGTNWCPKISSDLGSGAIITWEDYRSVAGNGDIYAQHINSNGAIQWTANGIPICETQDFQEDPQIFSDNGGGGIITWEDSRGPGSNIYSQRINSEGNLKWPIEGFMITNITGSQEQPLITGDGLGGAIIVWKDDREDTDEDIYAQRVKNDLPTSTHPEDIITDINGSKTINWTLYDDSAGGKYRVLANDTNGNYYTWRDWTSWANGTSLNVPINQTASGLFDYTIEYYDDQNQFGIPDRVIVKIPGIVINGKEISGYNILILSATAFTIVVILKRKTKLHRIKN